VDRFVTVENVRLALSGLVAAAVVGLAWRAAGRTRWGAVPCVLAVFAAARLTGRSDWPRWDGASTTGGLVTGLAAVGAVRLLADAAIPSAWVVIGSLLSTVGVWAGVPETGPALLAGGGLTGLAVAAALTRSRWAPAAGAGVAAVVGWAALSGASGRPWAAVGGALSAGVAPWWALRPLLPTQTWGPKAGPWLLCAHGVLVGLAARWIGVAPHAGWNRVAVVAVLGFAVAAAGRTTP
jgi:hypothetical protein